MKFQTSDWVQGKTNNGELIQGFIETIDTMEGIVRIQVVKSDNEDAVGKMTAVREHWIRKLPEVSPRNAEQIQSLIDLALTTWDEAWFMELTEQLKEAQEQSKHEGNRSDQSDESQISTSI